MNVSSNPISWMCNQTLDQKWNCTTSIAKGHKPWTVEKHEVLYCRSLPIEEHCELKFSVVILSVVIVCNLVKAACTLMTVWKLNEPTLVTIGDAINSFLQRPDITTAAAKPVKWDHRSGFWFNTASPIRWISTNLLFDPNFVSFQSLN